MSKNTPKKPDFKRPFQGNSRMAYLAILEGDVEADHIRAYVEEADPRLAELYDRLAPTLSDTDKGTLGRLAEFMFALNHAVHDDGQSALKVRFVRRRGRPKSGYERHNLEHWAAHLVEQAVEAGGKKDAEVAFAADVSGVSRGEIYKRLRSRAAYAEIAEGNRRAQLGLENSSTKPDTNLDDD